MQSRTWLFFLLSLLQIPGCAAAEKFARDELSKSHPNCRLYGHFYAPQVLFVPAPKSTEFIHKAIYGIYRKPTSYGFGLPPSNVNSRSGKSFSVFSELKEVDSFIHGNSQRFSGIDID